VTVDVSKQRTAVIIRVNNPVIKHDNLNDPNTLNSEDAGHVVFTLFIPCEFLTCNLSSNTRTLRYIIYDIYQLLHVSPLKCHPQGVIVT